MNKIEQGLRDLMDEYQKRYNKLLLGEHEAKESGDRDAENTCRSLQSQCRIMIAELFQTMNSIGLLDDEEIEMGSLKEDKFVSPKFLPEQWVLRYGNENSDRYIAYDYRNHRVLIVPSLKFATIVNEDYKLRVEDEWMSAIEKSGINTGDLSWKKVRLELVFPKDRSPMLSTMLSMDLPKDRPSSLSTTFSLGFNEEIDKRNRPQGSIVTENFSLIPKPEEPAIRSFEEKFSIKELTNESRRNDKEEL